MAIKKLITIKKVRKMYNKGKDNKIKHNRKKQI